MFVKKTFNRIDNLRPHKKNIHKKETGVQCQKCKKTFSRVDSLKRHQKVCGKFLFSKQFDLKIKYFCHILYLFI